MKTYTRAEIMKELDFKVEPKPLYTEDGTRVLKIALMRKDNNACLGVVSPKYTPVSHVDCFDAVYDNMSRQFGSKSFKITKFDMPKDGARVYVTFDVDNGIDILPKDKILPRMTMTNSFDGLLKFGFILGAFRVICSNGLRAGIDMFSMNMKHMGITGTEITGQLNIASTSFFDRVVPMYKDMAQIQVENKMIGMQLFHNTTIPQRMIEEVSAKQPEMLSAWDFYNAFTHHLTHEYKSSFERGMDFNRQIVDEFEKVVLCSKI